MPYLPPALGPEAYSDFDWLAREQRQVFWPLWRFFGLASEFQKPNTFVAKILFDIPVVVQNFDGALRAFENICLHRQAPLQMAAAGCRPLTCPYHGWNYDRDGKVAAIPHAEYYQFPPDALNERRLRRFAVEQIGGMVFVNLADEPMPIERQFRPELLDELRDLSLHFDGTITKITRRLAFNWKLIFENLRDGLHPLFLHRDSLYRDVKFEPAMMPTDVLANYIAQHECGDFPDDDMIEAREHFSRGGPDQPLQHFAPQPWHRLVTRYGDKDWYYNWLLFPNLHIASGDGGYSFTIEHYVPTAAGVTEAEIYYVTAKRRTPEDVDGELVAARDALAASSARILDEDYAMLESIQRHLHAGAPRGQWGAHELRNYRVAMWIARRVAAD